MTKSGAAAYFGGTPHDWAVFLTVAGSWVLIILNANIPEDVRAMAGHPWICPVVGANARAFTWIWGGSFLGLVVVAVGLMLIWLWKRASRRTRPIPPTVDSAGDSLSRCGIGSPSIGPLDPGVGDRQSGRPVQIDHALPAVAPAVAMDMQDHFRVSDVATIKLAASANAATGDSDVASILSADASKTVRMSRLQ